MPSEKLVYLLFLPFLIAALWFSYSAALLWHGYLTLDAEGIAKVEQIDIVQESDERYFLDVTYSFNIKNQLFQGRKRLEGRPFRNPWGAEKAIKQLQNKPQLTVFFSRSDPQKSNLEHSTPFKETIYAVVLWGLLAYFSSLSLFSCGF